MTKHRPPITSINLVQRTEIRLWPTAMTTMVISTTAATMFMPV